MNELVRRSLDTVQKAETDYFHTKTAEQKDIQISLEDSVCGVEANKDFFHNCND